jgi:glutathione synthase/RimK-type ligase-like ATP-grasp enzyme
MPALIISDSVAHWPKDDPNVDISDAWEYLTTDALQQQRNLRVFNLCDSYQYQTTGYYVSLLAEARGHKPVPSIITLQDIQSPSMLRSVSDELDDLIQKSLKPLQSKEFTLSVYFGHNTAVRYERLSRQLFNVFPAPLLRFKFVFSDRWRIRSVKAVGGREIPESHWPLVMDAAQKHFARRGAPEKKRQPMRYDMAILHDPAAGDDCPSNQGALKRFIRAGESMGIAVDLITKDHSARLLEYDALFIRATTQVNHYTYRFARRAASEGLVVMDDPQSIVRCTNKVYLAELMQRHKIATPKTMIVHKANAARIGETLGFPCVLKKPDSAFSHGVVKVASAEELKKRLDEFFGESDLLVAQEFLSTSFDWRIGILDRKPLFACKYYMARGHWQIIRQDAGEQGKYGKSETLPVELAPRKAVTVALKAANLIGDGLYGVDVKESNGNFYVIEVNDNPNLDNGYEDQVLRDELYRRVMEVFLKRIEQRKSVHGE